MNLFLFLLNDNMQVSFDFFRDICRPYAVINMKRFRGFVILKLDVHRGDIQLVAMLDALNVSGYQNGAVGGAHETNDGLRADRKIG